MTIPNEITPEEVKKLRRSMAMTQKKAGLVVGRSERGWQNWEYGVTKMHSSIYELFLIKTKGVKKCQDL